MIMILLGLMVFCGVLALVNIGLGPAPDEKGHWPWQRSWQREDYIPIWPCAVTQPHDWHWWSDGQTGFECNGVRHDA